MEISKYLHPEATILQMDGGNSEDVIRGLGDKLFSLGHVKDDFVDATLQREANMPTGLPLEGSINAAIPHVDIEFVNSPALGLATLKEPVTFYNMVETETEVPVRLVIMLALDQPKSQVEMLRSVAQVLQNTALVNQLMEATSFEEVISALK
ncbi:MAG: PTS sugar transporter subunit IIA [Chloroflexi bacterium]|nr:MAG: PTS sugar transporter subunit IIA [Chloroflexota bacterium]MBL1195496.1 PTS sugar transporter subunit IIA [Chloroflexota bacterium]NOH12778.1 PTS sugar transporter subunit IIA [Chloroflexota bacterium]